MPNSVTVVTENEPCLSISLSILEVYLHTIQPFKPIYPNFNLFFDEFILPDNMWTYQVIGLAQGCLGLPTGIHGWAMPPLS
jgi:hypothetical protein